MYPDGTKLLLASLAFVALLGAANASDAQLTLSWVDNSGGVAAFSIERRSGSDKVFAAIAYVPPGVTSYVDRSVVQGSTYCYRMQAYDTAGVSAYSDEVCATVAYSLTVTVRKAGNGTGTVTSAPAGISCGKACSATYPAGTSVTLFAKPSPGSTFRGWSGGTCSGTNPCVVAGNMSVAVTATFCRPGVCGLPAK